MVRKSDAERAREYRKRKKAAGDKDAKVRELIFTLIMSDSEDPASRKRRLANERQKRWRANQSQESLLKIRTLNVATHQKRISQMTPEQLAAHRVAHAASQQRYVNRLTPQQLEVLRMKNAASQRRRVERMSPEQLAAHRVAHAASQRRHVDGFDFQHHVANIPETIHAQCSFSREMSTSKAAEYMRGYRKRKREEKLRTGQVKPTKVFRNSTQRSRDFRARETLKSILSSIPSDSTSAAIQYIVVNHDVSASAPTIDLKKFESDKWREYRKKRKLAAQLENENISLATVGPPGVPSTSAMDPLATPKIHHVDLSGIPSTSCTAIGNSMPIHPEAISPTSDMDIPVDFGIGQHFGSTQNADNHLLEYAEIGVKSEVVDHEAQSGNVIIKSEVELEVKSESSDHEAQSAGDPLHECTRIWVKSEVSDHEDQSNENNLYECAKVWVKSEVSDDEAHSEKVFIKTEEVESECSDHGAQAEGDHRYTEIDIKSEFNDREDEFLSHVASSTQTTDGPSSDTPKGMNYLDKIKENWKIKFQHTF